MPKKQTLAKKEEIHSYAVIFEPVAEGGYNVVVPAIPEICTFGETLAEAKRMATDAIQCCLESAAKDRVALPRDVRQTPRVERLKIKLQLV
jgi:antitoxin HicB